MLTIVPELARCDLLCTDPPYGIGADKNLRANKQHGRALAPSKDYGGERWDTPPDAAMFDLLRARSTHQVIWGGNYFPLGPAQCFLVWDKDNGDNGYADCELAWTNLDKAVRLYRWRWMGMLQQDMSRKEFRVHPTQKPVAVMRWSLLQAPKTCKTVLDPYMGSGATLRAVKDIGGMTVVGIDKSERWCEEAALKLSQNVLSFED